MDGSAEPNVARLETRDFSVTRCLFPAWEAGDFASRSAASSIGFSFTTQHCAIQQSGRSLDRTVPAGAVVVVGGEAPDWLRVDRPCRLVEVSASLALRTAIGEELAAAGACDLGDLLIERDPVVHMLAIQLALIASRHQQADALAAEGLVRRLYGHVLRARFGGRLRERSDGALDPKRLARVIDYVDANPARPLTLAELADVAALSPFHFQRSFVRATGCSPHRMVMTMRMDRAREFIGTGMPEDEAARRAGFSGVRAWRRATATLG